MVLTPAPGGLVPDGERRRVDQTARFKETLRKLAIFDEGSAEAGSGLGMAEPSALDAKAAALLRLGASVAIGSSAICLEWSTARALAAGGPRTRSPACCWRSPRWPGSAGSSPPPDVATALECDLEAALEETNDH
jgi:hypothetical protein